MLKPLEYLQGLCLAAANALNADTRPGDEILQVLEAHVTDLRKPFFKTLPTSSARQEIQAGKVTLNDEECELNKTFIDECLQLSDLLKLDEIESAELLQQGTLLSTRYDREPFSCAIYLHYTSSITALDIVRLILDYLVQRTTDILVVEELRTILASIMQGTPASFARNCSTCMQRCRADLKDLTATQAKQALVGERLFEHDISLIQSALSQEHQSLALILGNLIEVFPDCGEFLTSVLQDLRLEGTWTDLISHQALLVIRSLQAYGRVVGAKIRAEAATITKLFSTWLEILVDGKAQWSLVSLQSALSVMLATELNGLCKNYQEISKSFDYTSQVRAAARFGVEHGAFQYLITFALFASKSLPTEHPFRMYFRNDAFSKYKIQSEGIDDTIFLAMLAEALSHFISSFIDHFADELKEMRLRQEDTLLTQEYNDEPQLEDFPSTELFMSLVYTVYQFPETEFNSFWSDTESDLYGFLAWASHAQTPSMIYGFFFMLSALVRDAPDALGAVAFLDSVDAASIPLHLRASPQSTLTFLFDAFRYYARSLDRSPTVANFKEPLEIDAQNSLILQAYLQAISKIVLLAPPAEAISIHKRHDCIAVYFTLLNCKLPTELYVTLLRAITVFAVTREMQYQIWQMVEQWLAGIDVNNRSYSLGQSVSKRQSVVQRPYTALQAFANEEASIIEAVADLLQTLVYTRHPGDLPFPELLGQNTRHAGIIDYVDFVVDSLVFLHQDNKMDTLQRLGAIQSCLAFIRSALNGFTLKLVELARADLKDIDTSISTTNLPLYITLHPGARVMQQLSVSKTRDILCGIIRNRNLGDISVRKRFEKCVEIVMDILKIALQSEPIFEEFILPRLPALTKLDRNPLQEVLTEDSVVIVQTTLVAASGEAGAGSANGLLGALLSDSTQDTETRLLAALISVDSSKDILHGYIEKFSTPDTSKLQVDILLIILEDISQSSTAAISHFLLGLKVLSSTHLESGEDSGEIGSGVSLLHALLQVLQSTEGLRLSELDYLQLEKVSLIQQIFARLVSSPLSSTIVMDMLRENDYTEVFLTRETSRISESVYNANVNLAKTYTMSMKKDAAVLTTLAHDLLSSHATEMNIKLQEQLSVILGSSQAVSTFPLLNFLDVLQVNLTSSTPSGPWSIFDINQYNSLVASGVSLENIKLALTLRTMQMPPGDEPAALELRNVAETERAILADHYERLFRVREVRHALFFNLQAIQTLFTLILDFSQTLDVKAGFANEVLIILTSHILRFHDSESEIADGIAECISSIMSRSALDVRIQETHARAFNTALIVAQSPSSTACQREHMYLVCVDYFTALFKHNDSQTLLAALKETRSSNERILKIVVADATFSSGLQKVSASMFLDALLRGCIETNQHWIFITLRKTNLTNQLFEHFMASTASLDVVDADAQLDVLTRLCMNPECSRDLQRTGILQGLIKSSALDLDKSDTRLGSVTQVIALMTCILLKPGTPTEPIAGLYKSWQGMLARYLDKNWRHLKDRKQAPENVTELAIAVDIMNELVAR